MNDRWLENPRQDGSRHAEYVTTLLVGGAGMLFLVGVGAAYSLALMSTGVLATMATVLVTVGLAGLLALAGVAAVRWSPPDGGRRGSGRGPARARPHPHSQRTRRGALPHPRRRSVR